MAAGIGPDFTTVADLLKYYKSCPVNERGTPVKLYASLVQQPDDGHEVTYEAMNCDQLRNVETGGMQCRRPRKKTLAGNFRTQIPQPHMYFK